MPRKKYKKKKVHTMSSVLPARNKAACEIPKLPKDPIPNIDASDKADQLAVVDYVEDLYKFYKLTEYSDRPHNYIGSQVKINERMREILGDWLVDVHHKFELMPETLYLTFYIIDKYLSMEQVKRRELQPVSVSSMLIVSNYEEIWAPQAEDFISISDRAYNEEQNLHMEKVILNKLEWSLTVPTPYEFLIRFIKAVMSDKELEHLAVRKQFFGNSDSISTDKEEVEEDESWKYIYMEMKEPGNQEAQPDPTFLLTARANIN